MFKKITKLFGVRGTVAAIIVKDSKILLGKRSKKLVFGGGKWGLQGGFIDRFESTKESIKREVKEEIGLSTRKIKFLFYEDDIHKNIHIHNVILVFKVETFGEIKTNWEVSEIGWFSEKEIEKIDIASTHKTIIKRFFKEKNTSK